MNIQEAELRTKPVKRTVMAIHKLTLAFLMFDMDLYAVTIRAVYPNQFPVVEIHEPNEGLDRWIELLEKAKKDKWSICDVSSRKEG